MIDYRAGDWGFHVAFGIHGSLAPRALVMAIPNAVLTLLAATWLAEASPDENYPGLLHEDTVEAAQLVLGAVTPVMLFILYNRSRTSYDRWWEGGTLLQKTRGEWFNAFSSIMAFTSTKPELQDQVDAYVHLLTRLMSLLMCCGLQQVSPDRGRAFEIFDLDGIEPDSMEFLNAAPDKVEIILQWIQRSMVLHQQTGVLPVAPPILSRAFQEVSRGIVNLQNARKIADFPYPYPLAQISMILQMIHYAATPCVVSLALPRGWAVAFSFCSIFVLWCIHFNALDLEFPFGTRVNDLPMQEFQQEWNNSVCTLVAKRATRPPAFAYNPVFHDKLNLVMSDASALYDPKTAGVGRSNRRKIAVIKISDNKSKVLEPIDKTNHINNDKDDTFRGSVLPEEGPGDGVIGTLSVTAVQSRRRGEEVAQAAQLSGRRSRDNNAREALARETLAQASKAPADANATLYGLLPEDSSDQSARSTGKKHVDRPERASNTAIALEPSAEKERFGVSANDIVLSMAPAPKAKNRNAAGVNVLRKPSLPLEPLILEPTASTLSETDEHGHERTARDVGRSQRASSSGAMSSI